MKENEEGAFKVIVPMVRRKKGGGGGGKVEVKASRLSLYQILWNIIFTETQENDGEMAS